MGVVKKKWLDRKSKKLQLKKYHKNKKKLIIEKTGTFTINDSYYSSKWTEYNAKAPIIFSFIRNTEEVIEYFDNILDEMEEKKFKQRFFLNSQEVSEVTTDVLVYIIAIIRNVKMNKTMHYNFAVNLPDSKEAQTVYLESGFLKYVKSKAKELPKSNSKMQIVSGTTTDQEIARSMCLFVIEKLNQDRGYTTTLFKTLIELMSNAVHHAYNKEELMYPCWYLFAEHYDDKIQFVFIDTGYGIANTVKKKFWEKIGINNLDSELIYSAFNGDFRTETNMKNRGLGLPALMRYALEGEFKSFFVISGKGSCQLENMQGQNRLTKKEYTNRIYGTIYSFEMAIRR